MAASLENDTKMNTPRTNRRNFLIFMRLTGIASLALWMVVRLLEYHHELPTSTPLFDAQIDAIFFGTTQIILETLFGGCLIGLIVDQYQVRVSERQDYFQKTVSDAGVVGVYTSSETPELIKALGDAIRHSSGEITCIGLGLSVLMNKLLLKAIADQLESKRKLDVNIIVGSADNEGIRTRVREEKACSEFLGVDYRVDWPTQFPKQIKNVILANLTDSNKDRFHVRTTAILPMTGILRFDTRLFVFLYGTPNMHGGSQSVWIELDNQEKKSPFVNWAEEIVEFHQNIESQIVFTNT